MNNSFERTFEKVAVAGFATAGARLLGGLKPFVAKARSVAPKAGQATKNIGKNLPSIGGKALGLGFAGMTAIDIGDKVQGHINRPMGDMKPANFSSRVRK